MLWHYQLHSDVLGAARKITVYLPPGHDRKQAVRVVYATDGEAIDAFVRVLEPLITAGQIAPTVVIAPHSGGRSSGEYDAKKDVRAQEYFPGLDDKRFADHESFFTKEVPSWAEKCFGISGKRTERAVFGYSNGGRFAVEMGIRHPELYATILGLSVAGSGKFDFGEHENDLPRFYLAAGTWDPNFYKCTSSLAEQLKDRHTSVEFSSRIAGHDAALWRDEFASAMIWAFKRAS
jgi:enterochelin esterase-like enzyme